MVDQESTLEILMYKNLDLENMVTPIKADVFGKLLKEANYDEEKTNFIISGFTKGFSLGYQGPEKIRRYAPNLKLTVGTHIDLWNKVMREVQQKRYVGLFKKIPFKYFIQSPIGLVPKDGGKNTCLIFHLLYPRQSKNPSVNANTLTDLCKVQYPDFAKAIQLCINEGKNDTGRLRTVYISRSDVSAASRNLGILKEHWRYQVMKAKNPIDDRWYFFVDKCLAFGVSISCKTFQEVSNGIAHIVRYITKRDLVNYLDDYYFCALLKHVCNNDMKAFIDVCRQISMPISIDKTVWACTLMTFLGFLIDTES